MVGKIWAWGLAFHLAFGPSVAGASDAASVPARIIEDIVTVKTPQGFTQQGVLSRLDSAMAPQKLLLVSERPGVTRPRLNESGRITTRQNGNFLVRARQHLMSPQAATLLLNCRSDFETLCPDAYQASADRAQDIALLVQEVQRKIPSLAHIWAVSTSVYPAWLCGARKASGWGHPAAGGIRHAGANPHRLRSTATTFDLSMEKALGVHFSPWP